MEKTGLIVNTSTEGETIEMKVERIVENKEPITDGAEMLYAERKEGVLPETNPKTDRWEYAVDSMDKIHKDKAAKKATSIEEAGKALDAKNEALNKTPEIDGTSDNSATSN